MSGSESRVSSPNLGGYLLDTHTLQGNMIWADMEEESEVANTEQMRKNTGYMITRHFHTVVYFDSALSAF